MWTSDDFTTEPPERFLRFFQKALSCCLVVLWSTSTFACHITYSNAQRSRYSTTSSAWRGLSLYHGHVGSK